MVQFNLAKKAPPLDQSQNQAVLATTPQIADIFVANHRTFLAFLERRVGSRAIAEDILSEAFVRGVGKAELGEAKFDDEESGLPFYAEHPQGGSSGIEQAAFISRNKVPELPRMKARVRQHIGIELVNHICT